MSVFQIPLGMNPKNNPLIYSPYDQGNDNIIPPPGDAFDLVTEGGSFILTEGSDFLTTE